MGAVDLTGAEEAASHHLPAGGEALADRGPRASAGGVVFHLEVAQAAAGAAAPRAPLWEEGEEEG